MRGELPRRVDSGSFAVPHPHPASLIHPHPPSMAPKPTGWNRLVARLQGEVPAAELEAFRRASAPVMELLEHVERRRLESSIDGMDPWTVPPATRAAFLCAWNAFVLQTLGDALLDADYRAEPRTPHFVPPKTATQVLRFYEPVEGWVNRGGQAQANPDYRLEVDVPAALPAFVHADPFPPALLDGLLHAMRAVRDHAAVAMEFLPATPPEEREKQAQLNRIRQLHASAQTRARYAEELCGTDPVPEVRERAAKHAQAAISQFYLLGQLASDPELARGAAPAPAPSASKRVAAPTPRKPARVRKAGPRPADTPPSLAKTSGAPGLPEVEDDVAEVSVRHSHRNATEAEHTQTFDFYGKLRHEVHFSFRLAYQSSPEAESVELRLNAWSFDAYPALGTAKFTVQVGGAAVVLRQMYGAKAQISRARGAVSFEQYIAYRVPSNVFLSICAAPALGMRFETTSQDTLTVDDATAARFHAYCRGFLRAIPSAIHPRSTST